VHLGAAAGGGWGPPAGALSGEVTLDQEYMGFQEYYCMWMPVCVDIDDALDADAGGGAGGGTMDTEDLARLAKVCVCVCVFKVLVGITFDA
jgi:hypothetical protein